MVGRHRARHVDDGALGRGVEQTWMAAAKTGNRCDVDDRSCALLAHLGNDVLGHQHHRRDIDAHRGVPSRGVDIDRTADRATDADVVDEDVDTAPGIDSRLHRSRARHLIGHVSDDDHRGAALGIDHGLVASAHSCCRIKQRDPAHPRARAILRRPVRCRCRLRHPAPVTIATLPSRPMWGIGRSLPQRSDHLRISRTTHLGTTRPDC